MNQNNFEETDLFKLYSMYELAYEENIKKNVKETPIYPNNWYRIIDYQVKIEILKDAINNGRTIMETSSYNNYMKGE